MQNENDISNNIVAEASSLQFARLGKQNGHVMCVSLTHESSAVDDFIFSVCSPNPLCIDIYNICIGNSAPIVGQRLGERPLGVIKRRFQPVGVLGCPATPALAVSNQPCTINGSTYTVRSSSILRLNSNDSGCNRCSKLLHGEEKKDDASSDRARGNFSLVKAGIKIL